MSETALNLRRAGPEDLEAIRALYNHHIRTGVATFDLEEKSSEDRRLWLAQFHDAGPHQIFVALDADGQLLGYACSSSLKPKAAYATSVEVSVYLRGGSEGRGLGRALYRRLFDALALTDLHRAYAAITRPNVASEALHQRFGFREAGLFREVGKKFGRYHDVVWLEKDMESEREAR